MKKLLRIYLVISLVLGSQVFILAGYSAAQTQTQVSSLSATNVTSESATLNGNLTDIGNVSSVEVGFEWGQTMYPLSRVTDAEVKSGNGTFEFDLTGLFSDTVYYFRAKATAAGNVTYGDYLSFKTLPIVPPSVNTRQPTDINATSAILHGNLASLGNASQVQVSFQWGLTTAYGTEGWETPPQTLTHEEDFQAKVYLSPDTTYYFRAKAVGKGIAYGTDVSFTTPKTYQAQISIEQDLDGAAATIKVNIDELRDRVTGGKVTGIGVACYEARASYDPTGVEMLSVRGADETFINPVFNTDTVTGETNFAEAIVIEQQPPVSVAKLVPRLLGSTNRTYSLWVNFRLICNDAGDLVEPQWGPSTSIMFQRGDVSGDHSVDIVDAMFGAQYLVGLKGYKDINLLNMASVHHDDYEDRADIVDCMYIAQYVVGARTSTFDLSSVPTPGYGRRFDPLKDNSILAGYPTVNTGSKSLLSLEAYNTANSQRVLMEFDLNYQVPAGATITSASLQLYYYGNLANNPAGLPASVYKLTRTNWTELGSTWNSYDGLGSWAGGEYATINPTKASTTFPASYGWMLWNVREIVQNAVLDPAAGMKVELLLRFDNENPGIDYLPTFYSRESWGWDPALVPKLVVSYTW